MAVREVTPNRRGVRSRELVLDTAERLMAEHGFEATSLELIVREAGIPPSSVYHYFGSKDGILLAVMERGAERFFAEVPAPDVRLGDPAEHLAEVIQTAARALARHQGFLRILMVFAVQPSAGGMKVRAEVERVRELALQRLREQIALAFGDEPGAATVDRLARFALASFDGAFIAAQTGPGLTVEALLEPLALALVAARTVLRPA